MKASRTCLVLLLGVSMLGATALPAFGQENPEATAIGLKVHQIGLLNQILPVLMTKDQIKKLLPVVEKARQAQRNQWDRELRMMREKTPSLDTAIKASIDKQELPSDGLLKDLAIMQKAFEISRQVMATEQITNVRKALKSTLNAGQIKAAAHALDPKFFTKEEDPTGLSEDKRLDIWIKFILLDWSSYDLLIKLSR